jgi:hypothetical protein
MLDSKIEYRRENYEAAFGSLLRAIKQEDNLRFPPRAGCSWRGKLTERCPSNKGIVGQAAHAYAEELGLEENPMRAYQHPKNVWALWGSYQCLLISK